MEKEEPSELGYLKITNNINYKLKIRMS